MSTSKQVLTPSIITSSSVLPLEEFFHQIHNVFDDVAFDLMVLRPEDTDQLSLGTRNRGRRESQKTITDIVADHLDDIQKRIANCFERFHQDHPDKTLRIAALATYFPDISSNDESRRKKACMAIKNCVKLSHYLGSERFAEYLDIKPCVEIVCGSLLEPIDAGKAGTWVVQYTPEAKIGVLIKSLKEIKSDLDKEVKAPYALALELEPGDAYVLNNHRSLVLVYEAVKDAAIDKVVGLNLDIAHFKIAGISAEFLSKKKKEHNIQIDDLTNWIVHSHIADHPLGMHTRDQAIGTFTDVECLPSSFCGYLSLLMKRASHHASQPGGLLFTNAVALELEGCSRMSWIFNSIPHLKRLLAFAAA